MIYNILCERYISYIVSYATWWPNPLLHMYRYVWILSMAMYVWQIVSIWLYTVMAHFKHTDKCLNYSWNCLITLIKHSQWVYFWFHCDMYTGVRGDWRHQTTVESESQWRLWPILITLKLLFVLLFVGIK